MSKVRILIADDHGIVRKGLRLQLEPVEIAFLVRPGLKGDRVTL